MTIADVDVYQKKTEEFCTIDYADHLQYFGLELASEAGEVADLVKRTLRPPRKQIDPEKVKDELGDCCYAIAQLAAYFEIPLSEVLTFNIKKLSARKLAGTIGERSKPESPEIRGKP